MDDPMSHPDERPPTMRVLVVDDSEDTARMMRVLIRRQGHEVTLAFTGREAIEAARVHRPDVVLLDLILPDMSGAEVAEELRRSEGFERTAFFAVSGYGPERIPAVFDGHFAKPLDHSALTGLLSRLSSEPR